MKNITKNIAALLARLVLSALLLYSTVYVFVVVITKLILMFQSSKLYPPVNPISLNTITTGMSRSRVERLLGHPHWVNANERGAPGQGLRIAADYSPRGDTSWDDSTQWKVVVYYEYNCESDSTTVIAVKQHF